jgi:hypothetical protein
MKRVVTTLSQLPAVDGLALDPAPKLEAEPVHRRLARASAEHAPA